MYVVRHHAQIPMVNGVHAGAAGARARDHNNPPAATKCMHSTGPHQAHMTDNGTWKKKKMMMIHEIKEGSGGRAPLATTQNRRRRTLHTPRIAYRFVASRSQLTAKASERAGRPGDYWYWLFLARPYVRVSAAAVSMRQRQAAAAPQRTSLLGQVSTVTSIFDFRGWE